MNRASASEDIQERNSSDYASSNPVEIKTGYALVLWHFNDISVLKEHRGIRVTVKISDATDKLSIEGEPPDNNGLTIRPIQEPPCLTNGLEQRQWRQERNPASIANSTRHSSFRFADTLGYDDCVTIDELNII
jgi:hypothetical protein